MYIHDLQIPGQKGVSSIHIEDENITAVGDLTRPLPPAVPASSSSPAVPSSPAVGIVLRLPGAIVFPGLINSHDHLDFNLFPLLGNGIYNNYTTWGRDIHAKNTTEIDPVLRIPRELRTRWGLYKNLLNGFTTVVNHGERLGIGKELISVHQDCHNLHSVGFEKNWIWKLNRRRRPSPGNSSAPSSPLPYVLHVGEGTDKVARREIDRLIRWNLFKKPLIGIHGVAMTEQQASHFKALVWCPDSNYFLLGATAPVHLLKKKLTLLFGTDSTLTSGWNSWDQIRMARKEEKVTDQELLDMLTKDAANIWEFTDRGEIRTGMRADLVIAAPPAGIDPTPGITFSSPGGAPFDALFSLNPENLLLVLHKGKIRLFDGSLLTQLTAGGFDPKGFYQITIHGKVKYTEGDLPGLMKEIRRYHPGAAFPPELCGHATA